MERKLATVRRIANIQPIPGADNIDVATVDGWQVVVSKGEFSNGELAVYLEVDSWVPVAVAPFLCKAVKSFNGVEGERLKTIRLKGQLSQGLLLPLSTVNRVAYEEGYDGSELLQEGTDVTEQLGIQKYEKPLSPQLAGLAKGNFPSFLRKTDQERIQNLTREFEDWKARGLTFEVSEKLDGSSMTVFFKDGKMGVCSRNLELKEDGTNTFWKVANEGVTLEGVDPAIVIEQAIQGELIGPGIQNNPYKLDAPEMRIFDVYIIKDAHYLSPAKRQAFVGAYPNVLKHVPVLATGMKLPETIAEVLAFSDGESYIGKCAREGLVWKCEQDPSISFKAISNKWLLKEKD